MVYDLFNKFTASFRLSESGPAEIARDRSRYKLQRAASLFADEAAENTLSKSGDIAKRAKRGEIIRGYRSGKSVKGDVEESGAPRS